MKNLKPKSEYLEFRQSVFDAMKLRAKRLSFVHGAVVDIRADDRILTLVSCYGGRTDIYVSNDAEYAHGKNEYEAVRNVTISFLNKAEKLISAFELTDDFSLDCEALENIFIFTKDGVYNYKITKDTVINKKGPIAFMQFLYKRILTEFVTAKSYSCMTRKCRKCLLGNLFGQCIIKKIVGK